MQMTSTSLPSPRNPAILLSTAMKSVRHDFTLHMIRNVFQDSLYNLSRDLRKDGWFSGLERLVQLFFFCSRYFFFPSSWSTVMEEEKTGKQCSLLQLLGTSPEFHLSKMIACIWESWMVSLQGHICYLDYYLQQVGLSAALTPFASLSCSWDLVFPIIAPTCLCKPLDSSSITFLCFNILYTLYCLSAL